MELEAHWQAFIAISATLPVTELKAKIAPTFTTSGLGVPLDSTPTKRNICFGTASNMLGLQNTKEKLDSQQTANGANPDDTNITNSSSFTPWNFLSSLTNILSGLERSKLELLAASRSWPVRATPTIPAKVPAVLDTPMTIPAYLGAMSMWFTAKPALPNAKKPRATEEHNTAPPGVLKTGSWIRAREATRNPIVFKNFLVLVTDKILLIGHHLRRTHILETKLKPQLKSRDQMAPSAASAANTDSGPLNFTRLGSKSIPAAAPKYIPDIADNYSPHPGSIDGIIITRTSKVHVDI
ncbi:hypothetical protein RJ641_014094 [Dillenia turbinata]|uniref:Uncharacterized protein n=1 Tax=Dillenia turbinata TaxID=194707 RepID=A0AAN8W5P1_9MAGN